LKRTACLRLVACAVPLIFLAGNATAGSFTFDGNTFSLTSSAESWWDAEAEAVSDGGYLASVHSLAEDEFLVASFVSGSEGQAAPLWLGFYDPTTNDGGNHAADVIWSDGSAIDYTNWNPGEPNNAGNAEYYTALAWHYAQGSTSNPDTWNDRPLDGSVLYGGNSNGPYYGIIEVAGPGTPEPATFFLVGAGFAGLALTRRFTA
jgi:hypothetical protein